MFNFVLRRLIPIYYPQYLKPVKSILPKTSIWAKGKRSHAGCRYMHKSNMGGRRSKQNIFLDCKSLSLKNGTPWKEAPKGNLLKPIMKEQKWVGKTWAFLYRCFNLCLMVMTVCCVVDHYFVRVMKTSLKGKNGRFCSSFVSNNLWDWWVAFSLFSLLKT